MLRRMIESAEDYHGWSLSDQDGARVVKLIKHKQRIVCSSFTFQLNRHFAEFESAYASGETDARGWQKLGLSGATETVETSELQAITSRYREAFKEFDQSILKRLQACIGRQNASIFLNPLHVKRLCESFQYAIDSLNLELSYKIALYHLFADRFVKSLGPLYRRIDRALLACGIMPELVPARIHLRSIEGLSESGSPDAIKPDQRICMLMLLQRFKEESHQARDRCGNLFPELKIRLSELGIDCHHDLIDQLNQIFKLIFEDEDLPPLVKQQLARLQIFIFVTAIHENGFLRRSSNPARRLLDGIIGSEVEIARNGNAELSGIGFIREHIDKLAENGSISVDSYATMLEGYKTHLLENETALRQARKIKATRKVMPLVKTRLAEITQPLKIQGTPLILFDKVWFPLLIQIALQQGMESDPWHKALAMVKKQVWSLIPKSNRVDQKELLEALPLAAHSLHRAMRSLKLAESLQQSLRDYLKLEQQNVAEETARNIIKAKRKTRTLGEQSFDKLEDTNEFDAMMQTGIFQVPAEMLETMNGMKQTEPEKVNQVEELSTGDWINMLREGKNLLVKLAWKAEDSSLYIFVDREGARICEIDAGQLARRFDSGDVSLPKSSSVDSEKTRFSILKSL